jgi:hypothetical protein
MTGHSAEQRHANSTGNTTSIIVNILENREAQSFGSQASPLTHNRPWVRPNGRDGGRSFADDPAVLKHAHPRLSRCRVNHPIKFDPFAAAAGLTLYRGSDAQDFRHLLTMPRLPRAIRRNEPDRLRELAVAHSLVENLKRPQDRDGGAGLDQAVPQIERFHNRNSLREKAPLGRAKVGVVSAPHWRSKVQAARRPAEVAFCDGHPGNPAFRSPSSYGFKL